MGSLIPLPNFLKRRFWITFEWPTIYELTAISRITLGTQSAISFPKCLASACKSEPLQLYLHLQKNPA
jgi:hypothetical protein